MSRKIIIDTDPGIDDAMAIFYALSSPELDVIGLTTIFGNAATDICTTNALRLLEIAGRSDIPVCAGAEKPLATEFQGAADFVHGADGQGDVNLPPPEMQALDKHAVDFIIDEINKTPGEIILAPLGPLTNIALVLQRDPDIAAKIKEIVLMGGNAFVAGNASPTAEANILNDPEAADIVFGAQCPITMIGLDVTEKVFMTAEQLDSIGTFANPQAQHIAQILRFYRDFYIGHYGVDGIHIHDSTVITYLLKPELFESVDYPIRVETEGISRGKTWAAQGRSDGEEPWAGRRQINICVSVDVDEAIRMELERLKT